LENLSGNPAQEYFSDGLTDELIGEVARIASLRVISRTSIMQYKGGARNSLPAIARELNVDAILEGTVVQSGRRVRITAQLIRAQDDRHLWSEAYERDVTDVLAVQSEVARAVAGQIQVQLTPGEQTTLARTRRVNPEAYEAFLKGNFFLHQGLRGVDKSLEFFKRAIELDGRHSDSYAGLAEALCYSGIFELRPSAETYPEARAAALKALELDESNAAAHNALADVRQGYDWDLAGAEVEFKRARQLNPSHLLTRLWYAESLTRMGRFDEAFAESARAVALDPVSPLAIGNRGMLFFRARRYDEAIRASQQALDLDPSFVNAFWWQGVSYAGKGDFPKSIAALTRIASMNDGPRFRALLGHVYARGRENEGSCGRG
jgi:TolB-like protein